MNKWRQNITLYFKLTRLCGHCWPSWPSLPLTNIVSVSAWNCHLIHDNDIGLLSTVAMKCLHRPLLCEKILSENFWTYFPSRFGKRTSFQSAFFNKDEFSLGPVFLIPLPCVRYGYLRNSLPGSNHPSNDVQSFNFLTIRWYKSHKLLSHVVFVDSNVENLKATCKTPWDVFF